MLGKCCFQIFVTWFGVRMFNMNSKLGIFSFGSIMGSICRIILFVSFCCYPIGARLVHLEAFAQGFVCCSVHLLGMQGYLLQFFFSNFSFLICTCLYALNFFDTIFILKDWSWLHEPMYKYQWSSIHLIFLPF